MTQESQQTASSDTPPVPKFGFKPGATEKPTKTPSGGQKEPSRDSGSGQKNASDPKKGRPAVADKKFQPKRYENLSTKARKSIQEALAELSHRRRKNPKGAIKYFIEAAVSEWVESKRSSIVFSPKDGDMFAATDVDPRLTFNNEIEELLKESLADICHERKKIGHPLSTVITILDDAFCQWLPKQDDLPQKYIDAVLQVSQESETVIE